MKRRVYDALNVLVAADVIKKKGKVVLGNDYSQPSGNNELVKEFLLLYQETKRLKTSENPLNQLKRN